MDGRLVAAPGQTTTMWPNVVKWPNNFTIEMDILGKPVDDGQRLFTWEFLKGDAWVWYASIHLNNEGGCSVSIVIADPGESQAGDCKYQLDRPNKYAPWVQDGRIRIYLNGERLMDLNQVNAPFQAASLRIDNGPVPVSMGPFRIAESAPDGSHQRTSTPALGYDRRRRRAGQLNPLRSLAPPQGHRGLPEAARAPAPRTSQRVGRVLDTQPARPCSMAAWVPPGS